jgi:hypothetical protein
VLKLLHGDDPGLPAMIPEPRPSVAGISFEPETYMPPAELREKIHAGAATQQDLKQLYFAL